MRGVFLSVVAVVLTAGMSAEGAGSVVPDVIESARADAVPVWVSVEKALSADGLLQPGLIESARIETYRRRLDESRTNRRKTAEANGTTSQDDCDTTTSFVPELFLPTGSTEDLVANSRYILSASVTERREGFYFGSPGTLLALNVREWLKRESDAAVERPLFLFFPQATIRTADGTICSKPWPRMPMPSIGDDVLLFSYNAPIGRDAAVFELRLDRQMSFQGRGGSYVPSALQAPSADLKAIVETVRRHPRIGERPRPREVR